MRSAGINAGELARTWSLLAGGFFDRPNLQMEDRGSMLLIRDIRPDGSVLICQADRPTLTPRRYTLVDPRGISRFTLELDRYEIIGGIPWPKRLRALSDAGRIDVELRDVELNGELPEGAFVPPRRAEKLP
jgi:hypothetical protein